MLEVKDVRKHFGDLEVLKGVSLNVEKGDVVAILGPSGSGKTTLLNMVSALDDPTEGRVDFLGRDLAGLLAHEKEELRRYRMGFVFQSVALVPVMSAYENVDFALRLAGYKSDRDKRIREVMDRVGLRPRMNHMANQLSCVEQQRVAHLLQNHCKENKDCTTKKEKSPAPLSPFPKEDSQRQRQDQGKYPSRRHCPYHSRGYR